MRNLPPLILHHDPIRPYGRTQASRKTLTSVNLVNFGPPQPASTANFRCAAGTVSRLSRLTAAA